MPASVRVVWDAGAVRALISSPSGAVAADLLRRGNNVRNAALQNMRSMGVGAKVGTGTLAGSIVVELVNAGGLLAVRVGSRLPYAIFMHEGHGEIRPVRAKVLRWPATGGTPRRYKGGKTKGYVYARRVRPVAGKPFLREALSAAAQ